MAKKPYYSIQNRTDKSVDILIYGVIGDSWFDESITAKRFVSDFKKLEGEYSRINIRINSPGGSVFDGLAIFNTIHQSTVDVHTYNDGLAASMGAVILMAGGTTHAAKNSLMMLHSPMTGVRGNAKEINGVLDMLEKVQNSLIECMTVKGNKTNEEIEAAYFDCEDHWLTADEASDEGFIEVIEAVEANVPENIANMNFQDVVNQFDSLMTGQNSSNKFYSWLTNILSLNIQPKNQDDMPKKFKRTATVCGLEEFESTENGVTLTSEQATAVETALETAETDRANNEGNATALETANTRVTELETEVAALKKKPGAKTAGAHTETDGDGGATEDENFFDHYAENVKILNGEN